MKLQENKLRSYIRELVKEEMSGHSYTDDMEDLVSNDDAYEEAFDSMEGEDEEIGVNQRLDIFEDEENEGEPE